MQVFKNKAFSKWAAKIGLNDTVLMTAVAEISEGMVDADLGSHIFKKRLAIGGRGKRGGVRTLLIYRAGDKAFFIYGFAKSVRANITAKELKALKLYAGALLGYSRAELNKAVKSGALVKVGDDG